MLVDQHPVHAMPILPSVTIKVEQSTVVHQTVLSFDHCKGNLNAQLSNFASSVTSF